VYDVHGGGVWGTTATNVTIRDNQIFGAGDVGLDLENCHRSTIVRNRVIGKFNANIAVFLSCVEVSVMGNYVMMTDGTSVHGYGPTCGRAPHAAKPCVGIWVTPFNSEKGRLIAVHNNITIADNVVMVNDTVLRVGLAVDSGVGIHLRNNTLGENASMRVFNGANMVIGEAFATPPPAAVARLPLRTDERSRKTDDGAVPATVVVYFNTSATGMAPLAVLTLAAAAGAASAAGAAAADGRFGSVASVVVQAGTPVNPLVFGVNQDWAGGHWEPGGLLEPSRLAAIRALGVRSIRFPAGTASQVAAVGGDIRAMVTM
jgi:hypothetical protein